MKQFAAVFAAFCLALSASKHPASAQQTTDYDVWFHTGDLPDRGKEGTDADIFITLYGSRAPDGYKSKTLEPQASFETGDKEYVVVSPPQDLGDIERIRIEHDNSGSGPGWYLEQVAVKKKTETEWAYFTIQAWLADDEGEGNLYYEKERDDMAEYRKNVAKAVTTPEGRWVAACANAHSCGVEMKESINIGGSEKNVFSNEVSEKVTAEVKTTYKAGVPILGGDETELTFGTEVEGKHSKVQELMTSRTDGYSGGCNANFDLTKYQIDTVYQWQITTRYQDTPIVMKTCFTACSHNKYPPIFGFGDPRARKSCFIPNHYSVHTDAAIDGHNKEVIENISLHECLSTCDARGWCKSADYRRADGKCYLQDVAPDGETYVLKRDYEGNPFDSYTHLER